jgi:hypothetical protein
MYRRVSLDASRVNHLPPFQEHKKWYIHHHYLEFVHVRDHLFSV